SAAPSNAGERRVRTAIRPLGASLLISFGACAAGDSRTTAELSSDITSGTVDEGDSAVVALPSSGQAYCTRTVLRDRCVLTAQQLTIVGAPAQTGLTDSGAPVLYRLEGREYVAGVASSGDAQCQQYARAVRVDASSHDFILPEMAGISGGCRTAPVPSLLVLALILLWAGARTRSSR